MSNYSRIRELVKQVRALEAEARQFPRDSQARIDRLVCAREKEVKAEWLSGRITDDEYQAELIECLDARAYTVDE